MPLEKPIWYRDDRPLLPSEIEAVVRASIEKLSGGPGKRFQVQSIVLLDAVQTTFGRVITREFIELNRPTFEHTANAYVNRLFRSGVLDSYFVEGHPFVHATVPVSKWEAIERDDRVDSLEYVQTIESIEDKVLAERIVSMIAAGAHSDSVVRESVTIVEDRLRIAARLAKEAVPKRTELASKAFNLQNGPLTYDEDASIQQGVMQLIQGYFLAIANDSHHRLGDYEWRDVARITVLSDYILSLIGRSESRSH